MDRPGKRAFVDDTSDTAQLSAIMSGKRRRISLTGRSELKLHRDVVATRQGISSDSDSVSSTSESSSDVEASDADESPGAASTSSSSSGGSDSESAGSTSSHGSSRSAISTVQEPEIVELPRPGKPHITSVTRQASRGEEDENILSRLSTFIPALAAANSSLEEERNAGTLGRRDIEHLDEQGSVDEDVGGKEGGRQRKPYIEMDLGLGVLEERDPDDALSSSSSSSSSSSDAEDDSGAEPEMRSPTHRQIPSTSLEAISSATVCSKKREKPKAKPDVLDRLMGRRPSRARRRRTEHAESADDGVLDADGEADVATRGPGIEEVT